MRHLNSRKLRKNLIAKGIICSGKDANLFDSHDYFQVVNAYKGLFVQSVENISGIFQNIDDDFSNASDVNLTRYKKCFQVKNASSASDFKTNIAQSICDKYGIRYEKTDTYVELKPKIEGISFIHHVYKPNTKYSDFVRMYEFEQCLRSVLLKYTLIIEENIKRIFISTLNNLESDDIKVEANFLANIDNYNTSANNTFAIQSLKKVIELYGDEHSKPILRKRNQNIAIPYWIIINEMTLGQTLKTISNINEFVSKKVFQTCLNEFTRQTIDVFDGSKPNNVLRREESLLQDFSRMLQFIGEFRNLLAHNQPIYGYNIEDFDLSSFPTKKYVQPVVPKAVYSKQKQEDRDNPNQPRDLISAYKRRKIANYMRSFEAFYGRDAFNSRISGANIDLSWMMYIINKISLKLGYDGFGDEVRNLYRKFNVIIFPNVPVANIDNVQNLVQAINHFSLEGFDYVSILDDIEKGAYKRKLRKVTNEINASIARMKKMASKAISRAPKSPYPPFPNIHEYHSYTGIDFSFLASL